MTKMNVLQTPRHNISIRSKDCTAPKVIHPTTHYEATNPYLKATVRVACARIGMSQRCAAIGFVERNKAIAFVAASSDAVARIGGMPVCSRPKQAF